MAKMKVNLGTPQEPNWFVMDANNSDTVGGKSANDFLPRESGGTLPVASEGYRGLLFTKIGTTGEDDKVYVCVKNSNNTYEWVDINSKNSETVGGNVDSVNGKTGEVVIDVADIAGLVDSRLALGRGASAGIYSVALGRDTSIGNYSVSLGQDASAESYSVALGKGASADNSNEGILGGIGPYITSQWIVPGSFTVNGTKNFEMPHPKPEKSATHRIRHGAVESPTAGDTLSRYKINATKENDLVTIDLPDYFVWLNKDAQIFVTPQGHFGNGYGTLNRETEQLEIHCQLTGEYNVLVIGTRNDDHQSVKDWDIKGVEREIGESWTGETYAFSVEEIIEVEEIKEEI